MAEKDEKDARPSDAVLSVPALEALFPPLESSRGPSAPAEDVATSHAGAELQRPLATREVAAAGVLGVWGAVQSEHGPCAIAQ